MLHKYKQKITSQTENYGTKDIQIMVPLKYLNNFWRTLGMPQCHYFLTWSENYIIVTADYGDRVP